MDIINLLKEQQHHGLNKNIDDDDDMNFFNSVSLNSEWKRFLSQQSFCFFHDFYMNPFNYTRPYDDWKTPKKVSFFNSLFDEEINEEEFKIIGGVDNLIEIWVKNDGVLFLVLHTERLAPEFIPIGGLKEYECMDIIPQITYITKTDGVLIHYRLCLPNQKILQYSNRILKSSYHQTYVIGTRSCHRLIDKDLEDSNVRIDAKSHIQFCYSINDITVSSEIVKYQPLDIVLEPFFKFLKPNQQSNLSVIFLEQNTRAIAQRITRTLN